MYLSTISLILVFCLWVYISAYDFKFKGVHPWQLLALIAVTLFYCFNQGNIDAIYNGVLFVGIASLFELTSTTFVQDFLFRITKNKVYEDMVTLGNADILLMFCVGAFVPIANLAYMVLIASILALVFDFISKKMNLGNYHIPMIPFMGISTFTTSVFI